MSAALVTAAVVAVWGGPGVAQAAPGDQCTQPGQVYTPVPWQQQMLGPERAWSFTQGGGITVAVLSTGVDADHPQLSGQVSAGFDAVANRGAADDDCLGEGTQVAGVIAARQVSSIGFAGVAPRVTILPIRVVDRGGSVADPAILARGVNAAVSRGANVIAVAAITYTDSSALQAAVAGAISRGVVVVAAAGDEGSASGGNPTPYPAEYDGVIGVGAIQQTGELWPNSQRGSYVDLVAPGAGVVTLQRGQGMAEVDGTGVACGFVAAAAALVQARRGSPPPEEVERQLYGTAIPTAGGTRFGHGIVNPYNAVVDRIGDSDLGQVPALTRSSTERSPAWERSRDLALIGGGVAVLAVLIVLVVAVSLPRGRRRFWRSAVAPTPVTREEPEEPAPPLQLFTQ